MKILQIIHGYPPEYNAGSEVYTQSVCNELAKQHEVVLFSREENDYALDFNFRETRTDSGIRHIRVNMARGKDGYNHALLNTRFGEILDTLKPDVAHIGHLNHLSTGIVDELNIRNTPILFTLHDFWLMCPRGQFLQRNFDGQTLYALCNRQNDLLCSKSCYSMYFSGIENEIDSALYYMHRMEPPYAHIQDSNHWASWIGQRMKTVQEICNKIDLFHAPSKYLRDRFINGFGIPSEKIIYLDYGFPTQYLQPVKPIQKDRYTFGYIGTHIPAKGINLLIEAFGMLEGNVALKIFGRTNGQSTNALRRLAENSKNPIEFAGEYINQNLATTVFNNIDCIVVPSIWAENSPLVIHEAQACRIPVITADYGGMAEYVHHMVNGLLFKHRDMLSLCERMQYAANHPGKMQELGSRGYLYHEKGEVPCIEDHCATLVAIYQKLIDDAK
ncbi:MAG: glycosyltransferase [Bacteroidales bacterium]|nr:glycosyltransferase [Bacteroidales bacterium]